MNKLEFPESAAMEEAFLAALHCSPLDEASRLALADWLEECNDPRAELIRLQVSLRRESVEANRLPAEARIRDILATGIRPCVPMRTNSLGMLFALVPPGTFWMGSPPEEEDRREDEPQHLVRITRPFYMGVHPVTQEQYGRVMDSHVNFFSAAGRGADRVVGLDTSSFPADSISCRRAEEFCVRLAALPAEGEKGWSYRLPTEAEWEYAARADASTGVPFHVGPTLEVSQANISWHPEGLARTCRVGSYVPNALGLFDLHGNVWEWCSDWFDEGYYGVSPVDDPQGPPESNRKVERGGSWGCMAVDCRIARRTWSGMEFAGNGLGFRVVLNWPARVVTSPPGS
jgi:uncharacterized protein (TIGR02996 family)